MSIEQTAYEIALKRTREELDNGTPYYNPIQFFEMLARNRDEILSRLTIQDIAARNGVPVVILDPDWQFIGVDEIDAEWLDTNEEGSDMSWRAQLREAGYGEDGRL